VDRSRSFAARGAALLIVAATAACAPDAPGITGPRADAAGPSSAKAKVTVPSAPQSVTAVAGDARATVTWKAPASDGGSAILGYRVVAAPGGAAVSVTTTSATVTGLTNGTSYTFTVVATNKTGASRASAPSAPVTPAATTTSARWLSGYYVGYERSLYPETSVDFSVLTHVILGAAQPTVTGGVTTDFYLGTAGPTMARNLSARAHQFGRKAILMVGGAGAHDALASAASNAYRPTFVANLLRAADSLGYDGLDVDWEPMYAADQPMALQLLRDLRAARPRMLLTFPIGWVSANGAADPWVAQVAPLVDQLNVMSYDMADNWGGWVSWHTSALSGAGADHPSSIASTVAAYRAVGVPAAKLGVGVPTYGACWRGPTTMRQTLAAADRVVASDNAMSYATIASTYYTAAAARWDSTASAGYLSFATPTGPQQCTLVSYETPQSAAAKGAWVKAQGLGGAIVWTLGEGHVATLPAGQQDPLVKAAYGAMVP